MRPQSNAVNVLERTSSYLRSGLLANKPVWLDVVGAHPPAKNFTRQPHLSKVQHSEPQAKQLYATRQKAEKVNLYSAPKIQYVEDSIRALFYKQHPWELSRPKTLVENDAGAALKYDWSSIQQLGKILDGESVVQRTLFLVKNGAKMAEAYDTARFEFYQVRIQQEIEEQVALEQAENLGAVFPGSAVEFGIAKEQEVIDAWKKKAITETEILAAKSASPAAQWAAEETEKEDELTL